MKGRKPGNTPENWLRCPQAWLLVSQGPYKPSSASLIPGGPVSPLIQLLSQGGPGHLGPHPFLQLSCDSAVFSPPFPYSFLSLAGNQIRQVENLRDLPHLQFLDLSENLIETLKLGRNALALAHGIGPGVPSLLSALPPLCPPPCACISSTSSRGPGPVQRGSGFGLESGGANLIPLLCCLQMNSPRAFSSST